MIGAALLRLGHPEQVRDFLEWYAPFQFPNGKVPCCVDARGADPVPENDSHGELVYAIADYFRYTGDTAFLASDVAARRGRRELHGLAARAAAHPRVRSRRAARAFRGLFPQSISHEGYSAKPMHSYWDDLFGLRGYKDAAFIAAVLGHATRGTRATPRSATRSAPTSMASYRASMAQHHIDFLPGSVELGDFDATSTTVGVAPVGELASLPRARAAPHLRRVLGEFGAAPRAAPSRGTRTRPTSFAPWARSCGSARRSARSRCSTFSSRASGPPPGTSGPRWCGTIAIRRSSSATCRIRGSARTTSARCSTCSRTIERVRQRARGRRWNRAAMGDARRRA